MSSFLSAGLSRRELSAGETTADKKEALNCSSYCVNVGCKLARYTLHPVRRRNESSAQQQSFPMTASHAIGKKMLSLRVLRVSAVKSGFPE
ncbi:MAG: hypothetical protein CVU57_12725 [Deltaproteobacteria bacterium HGW-Deltaproteobacteria-15]|jgi:hypothetical protein|nr:MAG: hypothetical protein CVU57_12725 [Deltaproteobacteria bacterium HGW-Deltaproteobacteria-15]